MKFRIWFAGAALAACIAAPIASNATTITGSLAAWEAAVGSYATTTSTGLPLYTNPVTEIALDDGMQLGFAGADDTVLQPGNGWIPWTSGYTGDIIDTTSNTETISFASSLSALGLQISPDLALFGSPPETFTVTLSDGTTAAISGTYPAGSTQFVGFYGGGVTSMTITATNAPDFAFGDIVDVPEPMSMALLLTGLAGLRVVRRRSRD
jgi:hypothetical protein